MTDYVLDHFLVNGQVYSGSNTLSITMDSPKDVEAVYAVVPPPPIQYTLTVQAPSGSGTTTPPAGSYPYNSGASANLAASPAAGWVFDHWLLDGSTLTQNPISILMNANHTAQAIFKQVAPPSTVTLTMQHGVGGYTGPGLGTWTYPTGTKLTIKATANSGYLFDHWTVNGVSYAANPLTITLNANTVVVAYFPAVSKVTLTMQHGGGGYTNPGLGTYTYQSGTQVTLKAFANPGNTFRGWSINGASYSGSVVTITLNSNTTATAIFVANATERERRR